MIEKFHGLQKGCYVFCRWVPMWTNIKPICFCGQVGLQSD